MMRRFSSGSVMPSSRARKRSAASTCDERDVEVALERLDDLRRLVLPHQAVVDVDAGQLVADRLVDEQRRDGGVDPAGERAEHALLADLRADALDLLLDHGGGRPGRAGAGDARRGSSSAPPGRAACARPRGGTGRRRSRAPAPRRPRSACSGAAVTVAPSGGAATESRWLIQPVCSSGRPSASAPPSLNAVLPNSPRRHARPCRRGPGPSAASRSRCRARGRRARRGRVDLRRASA